MIDRLRSFFLSVICLVLLCQASLVLGQTDTSVISILKGLEKRFEVVFSYSPKLLETLSLTFDSEGDNLDIILEKLSNQLPLKFEKAGESSVLVIPVRSPLKFSVSDINDQASINLIYIVHNNQAPRYILPNEGVYTIEKTFPTDSLSINTSFYKPLNTTVAHVNQLNGQVKLSPDTVDLGEVTILSYITSGVNSVLGDHRIEVSMRDLNLLAGETDSDVFQVLQAIPGIRSPNGKPGSLNLRGGPFDQNLMLFDNIPIYHTGHFFGTFSPYNPGIVDQINIYRGGLPAALGGRVGGVIDIKTQQEVPDSTSTGVLVNTVYAGLEFKTPIVKDKLGLLLSYRSRLPFDDLPPKLDAYYDLNFQGSRIASNILDGPAELRDMNLDFNDLNGKLVYQPNDKHNISLSFLNIDNDFRYTLTGSDRTRVESESSTLDNWGITLAWHADLSEKSKLMARYTSSSFRLREQRGDVQQGNEIFREFVTNGIDDSGIDLRLEHKASKNTSLIVGYKRSDHTVTFDERRQGTNPGIIDRRNGSGSINSIYASVDQQIDNKLIINAGLRTNYFSVGQQSFFAPRLFLTYLVSKSFFLKGSASGSYQFVRQSFADDFDDFRISNQFWALADENIPVLKGKQYMGGGLLDYGSWLFDLELYVKQVNNVVRPGGVGTPPNIIGDLDVKGVDLLVKKRWVGFESWVSYSLSHAQETFRERNGRVVQDTFYDQRHVLNFKSIFPVNRWNFALSWSLMSGVPVYPPDPDEVNGPGSQNFTLQYSGRFPAQHQMDLSASYRFTKPSSGVKGVLGMSIQNVYNRQNVINSFQQNVNVNNPIRFGLGFSPNIQLKITF